MKAVICPVCQGKGWIWSEIASKKTIECHGCDGKGWVEVQEEPANTGPYILPNPIYPYYPHYSLPAGSTGWYWYPPEWHYPNPVYCPNPWTDYYWYDPNVQWTPT